MTPQEYKDWNQKSSDEELNPAFILRLTNSNLLSQIIKGEIDLKELAKREMESRGLNVDGQWVGFNQTIN